MPTDSLVDSDKAKSSNVEFALTVSGSSSDFSIKENEFLAELKDTGKESSVDSDAGSNIKEHSFLSSAEIIDSPDKRERLEKDSKKDTGSDCSEVEDSLKNLAINSENLESMIETDCCAASVLEKEQLAREDSIKADTSVKKTKIDVVSDDIGDSDNEIVQSSQNSKDVAICDNELTFEDNHFKTCDNIDAVGGNETLSPEVQAVSEFDAVSELGAIPELVAADDVNSCEESGEQLVDKFQNDAESNEQESILSVYTQEETNADNGIASVKDVEEMIGINIESDNGKDSIPEHSFPNEQDSNASPMKRDENDDDAEDIIDHSFLANESALTDLLESSQTAENETEVNDSVADKDSKDSVNKDTSAAIDNESGSGSESDIELESPDSSPVRKRKFERPESPENAEYEFVFSVASLTDGKVGLTF